MNHLSRPLAAALLAVFACATMASNEAPSQRVEISAPHAGAKAAARVVLAQYSAESVYAMSTGQRLVVSTLGDSLHMRYGRRMPTTMRHDGQGSFVSSDGQLFLKFELDATGEPALVRLNVPASWL